MLLMKHDDGVFAYKSDGEVLVFGDALFLEGHPVEEECVGVDLFSDDRGFCEPLRAEHELYISDIRTRVLEKQLDQDGHFICGHIQKAEFKIAFS